MYEKEHIFLQDIPAAPMKQKRPNGDCSASSSKVRHILLLGGTGFVGSAVVQAFLDEKADIRLSMLVHRRTSNTTDLRVRLMNGSLQHLDLKQIARDPPTHVVHMARWAGSSPWRRTLAGLRGGHANMRLLRGLGRLPDPPRILYVSGSLMYGSCGEAWVDENTPLHPTSFARSYILGERPLLRSQTHRDLPVIMVRPPWILGTASWFASFYATPMIRHRYIPCYGEGRNWMSLLHIEDCARLIKHTLLNGEAGQSYNLTLPPVRQRDFCALLSGQTGLPIVALPLNTLARPRDRTLIEAFNSSIRLRSRHDAFLRACPLHFGTLQAAVADILSRLEHIQRILPETP